MTAARIGNGANPSFPRRRGQTPRRIKAFWMPACAGMTKIAVRPEPVEGSNHDRIEAVFFGACHSPFDALRANGEIIQRIPRQTLNTAQHHEAPRTC